MDSELFQVLVDDDVPASKLRAEDVVVAGRQRLRRRRAAVSAGVAGVGGLVAVALIGGALIGSALVGGALAEQGRSASPNSTTGQQPAASSSASGVPTGQPTPGAVKCTVAALRSPRPNELPSLAAAVDPSGRYIAGAFEDGASKNPAVVLWTDEVPKTFTVGTHPAPHAVNASGKVVGQAGRNGRPAAWAFENGHATFLPMPPGATESYAFAVNARGDVAGEAKVSGRSSAVVWPAGGGVTVLTASGASASARGITDDGVVVGSLGDGNRPYLWRADGTGAPLPSPDEQTAGKALGVQGSWAFGWAGMDGTSGDVRSVRWNLSSGQVQAVSGVRAMGIAADGTVAGLATDTNAAVIWRGGVETRLPYVNDELSTANSIAISADGKVLVGAAIGPLGGRAQAVVWHC